MAGRKDIEAGRAHVTLYAKTSPLMQGLKAVQGHFTSWGKSIMGLGAGVTALGMSIVGSLAGAVKVFADTGSQIADIAARTQVSSTAIAELGYAAEQSGSSLETVGKALIAMQKQGLDPKRFDEVAAAIAAIPNEVDRTNAALAAFGKAGAELLPMLGEVAMLRQQARDLGIIPSEQAVQDAAKIGDKFDQVKSQIIAGIFEIGAALAPMVIPILESMTRIGKTVLDWIRKNAALVRTVALIGVGLTVVGGILIGFGATLVAIGIAIGGVMSAIAAIGPILAAVFSPVGLIVVAIVAIGAAVLAAAGYWLFFTEQGKAALAWLQAAFAPVIEAITKSIGGIGDALMSGDIQLAAQIAAVGMELVFVEAINSIIKHIGTGIPNAIAGAMKALAEFAPTDYLKGLLIGAGGAAGAMPAAFDGGAADLREKLNQLRERAASQRAALDDGNAGQYGDSMGGNAPAMERLKSFGSFDATALTMQNYGKGIAKGGDDPQKKAADFLQDLAKKLVPQLITETKENKLAYGP
jgi:hypothetical protein